MAANSEPAIEATGLVKTFRATRAVDGVDLVVPTDGVFGAGRLLTDALGSPVQTGSDDNALSARVDDPGRASLALAGLARAGIDVTTFALGQPSLDEVFLALTGHRPETDTDQEKAA